MPAAQFDTLRYVETLTAAGVHESQAKAGAVALANAFGELSSGFLATRGDIAEARAEIHAAKAELKGDIAELRTELKGDIAELRTELKGDIAALRAELKGDIAELRAELRAELKGDIAGLRTELKGDIADIRSELKLIKWMNVTVVAAIVSYVSRSFF